MPPFCEISKAVWKHVRHGGAECQWESWSHLQGRVRNFDFISTHA
jgi:hypothetical protein